MSESGALNTFKLCWGPRTSHVWRLQNVSYLAAHWDEDKVNYYEDDLDDENFFNLDYICVSNDDETDTPEDDNDDVTTEEGGNLLKNSFFIDVDACSENSRNKPARSRLRLHLLQHSALEKWKEQQYKRWLSLNVEQLLNLDNLIVQYHFHVEATLEGHQGNLTKKSFQFQSKEVFIQEDEYLPPPATLKKKILQLPSFRRVNKTPFRGKLTARKSTSGRPPIKLPQGNLLLKISVTPVFISVPSDLGEKGALCQALKNGIFSENTYADIQLETEDKELLSAHKFVLASRSPFFKAALIEKEEGIVLTTKHIPMRVVLYWMYTAELPENVEDCMEEVVEAAVKYELPGLVKSLERKIIDICDSDNMIRLLRLAKKRKTEMPSAFAEVTKFVKKDLDLE